jgi:hypothetical protein
MTRLDRWIDRFIRRVRDDPRTRMRVIGPVADPLMHRYFVIRRNRWLNIYLHRICRSDIGELHDHRMASISIVLQGRYFEQRFISQPVAGRPLPLTDVVPVERLRPLFRWADTPHRLLLEEGEDGKPVAVWSLFIGGPRTRNWGFWSQRFAEAHWFPHEEWLDEPPAA